MPLANQLYGADTETEPEGSTDIEQTEAETTETETEEPTEANQTSTRRVTAELDGREIEIEVLTEDVDLDQIPKSFLMEKGFRQKTMQLADQMREVEKRASTLDNKLIDLSDQIEFDMKELESEEMQKLKEQDPDEFERKRLNVEKKLSRFKSFQEERNKELSDQQKKVLEADRSRIGEVIPEWLDDKSVKEDLNKMGKFLGEYGVTNEEAEAFMSQATSVALATLRKAALYDEIQAASVEKNVSRKAPKTGKPNSSSSQEANPKKDKTYAQILYG